MTNKQKILLTGVSSGIGRAIAASILEKPENTLLGLARRAKDVFSQFPNYHAIKADFSKPAELESLFKNMSMDHPDINILILSAGVGKFGELEQLSLKDFQNLLNVNFLSQAMLIKYFIKTIKKNQGKIIVVGSESALAGAKKGSAYCASKFAMRGFIQCVRQETRQSGVSVSLVNPGLVNTEFFDSLQFAPHSDPGSSLHVEHLVSLINQLIALPNACVVEEVQIQPVMARVISQNQKINRNI